jgi:hypothetical protein
MRTPAAVSFGAQPLLIALADLLQDAAHTIEIGDLPAHLSQLIGMYRKLTGFAAWVIYVQNPLVMAFAADAGGAGDGRRMKGAAFEQRATQQVIEGREFGEEPAAGLFLRHLYRCYTNCTIEARHIL